MNKPVYLYVTPFFPEPRRHFGSYCLDAVKALVRDGRYDVRVFYPEHQTADVEYTHGEYEIDGVKVYRFGIKRLPGLVFPFMFRRCNQRLFLKAVRQAGIDVNSIAVCHGHTALFSIYPLAIKDVNARCLTLLHHHDLQSFGLNNSRFSHCWIYNLIEFPILRWWHSQIDCHVFISEMVRKSFLSAPDASWSDYVEYRKQMQGLPYRPTRIKASYVLYNGVDAAIFNSGNQAVVKRFDAFTIGCIGNFQSLKGHLTLLGAVRKIRSVGVELHVRLVGRGPALESCKDYVAQNDLARVVSFEESISHDKITEFYHSLDLFVLPSVFEGFGCVYTEAWACGTPFITTSGAGVVELIPSEDRHLWVVKPHDVDDLVEKIMYYYQHRDRQRLVGAVDIETLTARFLDKIDRFRLLK